MIAEINIFGVFVSGALFTACLAAVALFIVRSVFLRLGFYRFVWHRHLVDLALFTVLWAAVAMATPTLMGVVERAL
jgi:hypothetical protein